MAASLRVPLVLDTDIGTDADDAVALAFAALDPRIDLLAVTTVNGPVELRAALARAVLDLAGRSDVPVAAGRPVGLTGRGHTTMPIRWGHEGKGVDLAPPAQWPRAGTALPLLVEVVEEAPAPVTVCCIGALTNAAELLVTRPDLIDRLARIVLMGGALGPVRLSDDVSAPALPSSAETNLGCDPVAAAVVLASAVPVSIVPVDLTMPLVFTDADRTAIAAAGALGRTLGVLMDHWVAALSHRRPGLPPGEAKVRLHDPLTVVAAAETAIEAAIEAGGDPAAEPIARWEDVRVVLRGGAGAIETVTNPAGRLVRACRAADAERLRRLLVGTIAHRT